MPRKTKKTPAPKPDVEPRPMTDSEKRRFEEFVSRRQAKPVAVKFVQGSNGEGSITQDVSYGEENTLAGLAAAMGSVDRDFCHKLLNQAANSSPMSGLKTPAHVNAIAATGVDPISWTDNPLRRRGSRCRNAPRIPRNSVVG